MGQAMRIDDSKSRHIADEEHRHEIRRRVRAILEEGGVAASVRTRLGLAEADDDAAAMVDNGYAPSRHNGSSAPVSGHL